MADRSETTINTGSQNTGSIWGRVTTVWWGNADMYLQRCKSMANGAVSLPKKSENSTTITEAQPLIHTVLLFTDQWPDHMTTSSNIYNCIAEQVILTHPEHLVDPSVAFCQTCAFLLCFLNL